MGQCATFQLVLSLAPFGLPGLYLLTFQSGLMGSGVNSAGTVWDASWSLAWPVTVTQSSSAHKFCGSIFFRATSPNREDTELPLTSVSPSTALCTFSAIFLHRFDRSLSRGAIGLLRFGKITVHSLSFKRNKDGAGTWRAPSVGVRLLISGL